MNEESSTAKPRRKYGSSSLWDKHKGETIRKPRLTAVRRASTSEKLTPEEKVALNKMMSKKSFEGLYSTALGLPSRVRRFIRKLWKLEDAGKEWEWIADNLSQEANKILNHRMDVVVYTAIVVSRDGDPGMDRLMRLSEAMAETDELLTAFSHYFLIGLSAKLVYQCTLMADKDASRTLLGGLAHIADFGVLSKAQRRKDKKTAIEAMRANKWELPERDTNG